MATEVPIPEWVKPGAEIVIRPDRAGFTQRRAELIVTTVDRLTATLVITVDGRRIPRRDIYAGSRTYLNPADPDTQAARAAQAELKMIRYLESRLTDYLRNGIYGNAEDRAEARTHLIDLVKATAAQLEC